MCVALLIMIDKELLHVHIYLCLIIHESIKWRCIICHDYKYTWSHDDVAMIPLELGVCPKYILVSKVLTTHS